MYELPDDRLDWYALWTAPQREAKAKRDLLRMGVRVELPVETRLRRASRRARQRTAYEVALLPRYLFAGFYGPPPWYDVLASPNVYGYVVGTRGQPVPVDYEAMCDVVERATLGVNELLNRERFPNGIFKAGDDVTIRGGPFEGFPGRALALKGRDARVAARIFGRETSVWVPLDQLAPAA